jgi:hypothetical protein
MKLRHSSQWVVSPFTQGAAPIRDSRGIGRAAASHAQSPRPRPWGTHVAQRRRCGPDRGSEPHLSQWRATALLERHATVPPATGSWLVLRCVGHRHRSTYLAFDVPAATMDTAASYSTSAAIRFAARLRQGRSRIRKVARKSARHSEEATIACYRCIACASSHEQCTAGTASVI